MAAEIMWTEKALIDLENISEYIFSEFGKLHFNKFSIKLAAKLKVITSQPFVGSATRKNKYLRKTQVSKITILVYRYKPRKNIIEILQLWDGRRNPKTIIVKP